MTRYKIRGKYVTWLMNKDYGWFRILRVILRWEYTDIKIQYIGKAKKVKNVVSR